MDAPVSSTNHPTIPLPRRSLLPLLVALDPGGVSLMVCVWTLTRTQGMVDEVRPAASYAIVVSGCCGINMQIQKGGKDGLP